MLWVNELPATWHKTAGPDRKYESRTFDAHLLCFEPSSRTSVDTERSIKNEGAACLVAHRCAATSDHESGQINKHSAIDERNEMPRPLAAFLGYQVL
jgi:hypothetical protein